MKLKSGWLSAILITVGLSTILVVTGLPSQASVQERKVSVPPSELPAVIKKAIEEAFPNGRIIRIQKEVEGEDPGQYDVDIRSGSKEYEVEISPEGNVIESKEIMPAGTAPAPEQEKKWTDSFAQENCTFSSVGRNRFFILAPGNQLILQSRTEKVVITVLDQTRKIGGVKTRVVEEREEQNGELKEVSRNFFAVCREHGDVFYFGEEVDIYEDGRIVKHSGQWRADEKNSRAGIIMPGTILLGARHYQEISPKAMDRAEIISDDVTMKTPAGTFKNCIRVEETSGIDPEEKCYKTYAPGLGLIQDEDLLLTKYRKAKEEIVSLKDLPRAVRAALKKHAAGGKITEIVKETVKGKLVYEAEVLLNGRELDILVSAKGKYLGTEKEEETKAHHDDENDEDDDDDEDDNHDDDEDEDNDDDGDDGDDDDDN